MTLSPMAETALHGQVTEFLDHARALSARGEVDAALALYDFPLVLVQDEVTEVIADRDRLRRHLRNLAELRDAETGTIWYQEVGHVHVLTRHLVLAVVLVRRLDERGKPLAGVPQSLILRRGADGFRFASVVNPIRHGYWTDDPGVFD